MLAPTVADGRKPASRPDRPEALRQLLRVTGAWGRPTIAGNLTVLPPGLPMLRARLVPVSPNAWGPCGHPVLESGERASGRRGEALPSARGAAGALVKARWRVGGVWASFADAARRGRDRTASSATPSAPAGGDRRKTNGKRNGRRVHSRTGRRMLPWIVPRRVILWSARHLFTVAGVPIPGGRNSGGEGRRRRLQWRDGEVDELLSGLTADATLPPYAVGYGREEQWVGGSLSPAGSRTSPRHQPGRGGSRLPWLPDLVHVVLAALDERIAEGRGSSPVDVRGEQQG